MREKFYLRGSDFALSEIVEQDGSLYFNNIYTPQVIIEYIDNRGLINSIWDFPEDWEEAIREKLGELKNPRFY